MDDRDNPYSSPESSQVETGRRQEKTDGIAFGAWIIVGLLFIGAAGAVYLAGWMGAFR